MKRILFLIHDLGQGGAEKVLVNLVNNMDSEKFDISVIALFGGGVNEQFLKPHIKYKAAFSKMIPGNSKIMKLFSPKTLYKFFVKDKYDIIVSYLEGPSARIVSGCPDEDVKRLCFIHGEQKRINEASASFRSVKEAASCYGTFDRILGVSKTVVKNFSSFFPDCKAFNVIYNTNESEKIKELATAEAVFPNNSDGEFKLISVGSLKEVKGFDRLIRVHKRLTDLGVKVHTYVLGKGKLKDELESYAKEMGVSDTFTLLGYDTNPYKYVSKADLYVCSSYAEGFSTAATEALIVGTPVCTVRVSGMDEMLGDNEYGIVCDNDEEALYKSIKKLLDDPALLEHYKKQAELRGKDFSTEETVKATEDLFLSLLGENK